MVKAEKAFKWGIAIIVIFGILNAFYFLHLVLALKIALPILCVFMIGAILLQSGKGGGLAAIGGLGDQSAFGTKSSSFLTRVTYLIGAAFLVTTIFLFKLSVPSSVLVQEIIQESPASPQSHDHSEHDGHDHGEHDGHDHGDEPHAQETTDETSQFGMQGTKMQGQAPEQPHDRFHKENETEEGDAGTAQSQSMGMAGGDKEEETSDIDDTPATQVPETPEGNNNE